MENGMDIVRVFSSEMSSIFDARPPASKAKIASITKSAIKGVKMYKHIVQVVEKFIYKCRADYKLTGLYVLDSICRQSRHQFGSDKDLYVPRFLRNLKHTVESASLCIAEDKDKLTKLLQVWKSQEIFPEDMVNAMLVEHVLTNKVLEFEELDNDACRPDLSPTPEESSDSPNNIITKLASSLTSSQQATVAHVLEQQQAKHNLEIKRMQHVLEDYVRQNHSLLGEIHRLTSAKNNGKNQRSPSVSSPVLGASESKHPADAQSKSSSPHCPLSPDEPELNKDPEISSPCSTNAPAPVQTEPSTTSISLTLPLTVGLNIPSYAEAGNALTIPGGPLVVPTPACSISNGVPFLYYPPPMLPPHPLPPMPVFHYLSVIPSGTVPPFSNPLPSSCGGPLPATEPALTSMVPLPVPTADAGRTHLPVGITSVSEKLEDHCHPPRKIARTGLEVPKVLPASVQFDPMFSASLSEKIPRLGKDNSLLGAPIFPERSNERTFSVQNAVVESSCNLPPYMSSSPVHLLSSTTVQDAVLCYTDWHPMSSSVKVEARDDTASCLGVHGSAVGRGPSGDRLSGFLGRESTGFLKCTENRDVMPASKPLYSREEICAPRLRSFQDLNDHLPSTQSISSHGALSGASVDDSSGMSYLSDDELASTLASFSAAPQQLHWSSLRRSHTSAPLQLTPSPGVAGRPTHVPLFPVQDQDLDFPTSSGVPTPDGCRSPQPYADLPPPRPGYLSVLTVTIWVYMKGGRCYSDQVKEACEQAGHIVSFDVSKDGMYVFIVMSLRQAAECALGLLKSRKATGLPIEVSWTPGRGIKKQNLKQFFDQASGITFIPWTQMQEVDQSLLEDGAIVDGRSAPNPEARGLAHMSSRMCMDSPYKDLQGSLYISPATNQRTVRASPVPITPPTQRSIGLCGPPPSRSLFIDHARSQARLDAGSYSNSLRAPSSHDEVSVRGDYRTVLDGL